MFNHLNVELPTITATTTDGVRLYETPEGNFYPSITTVLSVKNKQGLTEWRKRVGDDVANYVAGKAAETSLGRANITCNKNGIPFDTQKMTVTSGIRLGSQAATTRGFGLNEFKLSLIHI